jgi:uncharacterized membrane protein YoaT (DUF817 family)
LQDAKDAVAKEIVLSISSVQPTFSQECHDGLKGEVTETSREIDMKCIAWSSVLNFSRQVPVFVPYFTFYTHYIIYDYGRYEKRGTLLRSFLPSEASEKYQLY